jgi:alanine-glyoxylate transaminase / serine-glyoxylate transaminase / serine-pyruvate transaminase
MFETGHYATLWRNMAEKLGLTLCENPEEYSSSLTAILVPDGYDADELRRGILHNFNMSLGTGLGKLIGKVFRIGHLGDFNDLMLLGTLGGVEMGLSLTDIPFSKGGDTAALDYLTDARLASKLAVVR